MARGIYKIINVINNKFYVGSSEDFSRRKREHWRQLRRGTHCNKHLQEAWLKYGESAFTFVIVEELPPETNVWEVENIWLKEHVGKNYCYNIATNAASPPLGMSGEKNPMWGKTFFHTEEAKAKIAAAAAARVQTEEEKAKRRKSMRGHHIAPSTKAKISAALSGEGNYWYGKKRPDHGAKVRRAVVATNPEGKTLEYASISELREVLGMTPPTINRALKSGRPLTYGRHAGWSFKYLDTPHSA